MDKSQIAATMIDLSAKVEGQIAEIEQLREALSAMTELFKATEASAQWALSEVERLREALRPFACKCEGDWCENLRFNDDKAKCENYIARAALGEKE